MDPRDHLQTNLVAGALTSTHLTIRTLMPLLLAVLGTTYGFAEGRLGEFGAAYSAGATLAAMTSPLWMGGMRMRGPALILLAAGLAAVSAMLIVRGFVPLMLSFALAGFGHGGVFALMIALLSRTDDPNRSFGWQWCLGSLPGILLVYLAPALSSPANALWFTVALVLGCNALLSVPALCLPERLAALPITTNRTAQPPPVRHRWPLALGLFAIFATYAGITGAWSFLGRIALGEGLDAGFSGIVLAFATAASGAVSLLAGEIGDRGARPMPMLIAALGIVATMLMTALWSGRLGYAVSVIGATALAGWLLPFVIGIVPRIDPGGRTAGLPAAALGVGAAAGPAIAGHVYQAAGVVTMMITAAVVIVAGLTAYVGVHHRAFRSRAIR